MDEEKTPLLRAEPFHIASISSVGNEDDSFESSSVKVESVRVPMYGTDSGSVVKIVPIEERITYTWNNLNAFTTGRENTKRKYWCCGENDVVENKQRKHILKNVNGVAHPGELLAVLGSSGSGKTTLLNALTFRPTREIVVTGTRCMNGVPVNSKALTKVSAYVQQDDLFIDTLTVREHLIFQALVRMDKNIKYEQRLKRVEEVLSELTLRSCENTQIGCTSGNGISGGEKKRLAFAAEVLTNPSMMFCDEPTSGLDSFMALNVVQVLKTMAQGGKTVVCTIHQPSSELYAMFDKLLLMSEGRVAFMGSPHEADEFFREIKAPCPRNFNPADYFIQLLAIVPGTEESSRQAVAMICDTFEKSDSGIKVAVESATGNKYQDENGVDIWSNGEENCPYKASWWAQFQAVLWRSWISIMKHPSLVKVRLLQTIMVSLVIGAIYYGQEINQDGVMNINGVLFIFLTNMTFQNVYAVINVFCSELPIFLREQRNGMYRTDVYFLSKTLAELPFFIVLPFLFTSVCYFIIGLNSDMSKFLFACVIVILVANVATSFGYMISCLSATYSMALSLGPPLIIPSLLFGGFFLNINSIPVYLKWASYLSWFKYGNEALLINQWENIEEIECPIGNSTCPPNGRVVLKMFNFMEENLYFDVICLFCLIVSFRLVAFFALLRKTYK
ncbi:unnamed protein product [Phaedon cochleariae]|uniref:Protein white n=1 Tax=Phaedon cochleariae TaxID=80249 RepID=A0A9P0DQ30_PHACE|nr:unnamed protein product [Phaedon cochleariae]